MAGTNLRIEVLVAYPPTLKCKEILAMAEESVKLDSRLRLDVYESGAACPIKPTAGWMKPPPNADHVKFKKIPSIYINGCSLACGEVPGADAFKKMVEEQLGKEWQD